MGDLEDLRQAVYRTFVEHGRAPSITELARTLQIEEAKVREGLEALHAQKQLVLDRERTFVRMAHPFSAEPMGFVVEGRDVMWWGGCAWDSFAIGAALQEPIVVTTRCPHCTARITVAVAEGGSIGGDPFVAHFLVPVRRFWDDVVYTCSNQRMFCSGEHVTAWLAANDEPEGARLSPEQLWQLAQRWYRTRLERNGRRPTVDEARRHFLAVGLEGPFWGLG